MSQREANRQASSRINKLFYVFLAMLVLISVRVVGVQVFRSGEMTMSAEEVRLRDDVVPARRGEIFDAKGVRLATDEPASSVGVTLEAVVDKQATAQLLSPLIGRSVEDILDAISQDKSYVLLARHVGPEVVAQIKALNLPGIDFTPEPGRAYPFGPFAAQVLGFTNADMHGNYGIEGFYDEVLHGQAGKLLSERAGQGEVIGTTHIVWKSPIDGQSLILTLDSAVQRAVEQILVDTIREQHARGGTIIVQDTRTGAIIAMANAPTYDPNAYAAIDDPAKYLNPAVSAIYEPGSTFKSVVMALGVDTGAVKPDSTWDDTPGFIELDDGARIYNFERSQFGEITVERMLQVSSNLGAAWVAKQTGEEHFYQGLQSFGFGEPTGVDLQGEEGGILTLPDEPGWNTALPVTNAFGQGIACTPLQLINAFSAIVNGGVLMQPYIVAENHGPAGDNVHQPQPIRRVISEQTSATMVDMLESVVHNPQSLYPSVPGYRIGAKTGTAQIPSPDGGYIEDATIASIVGFGPVEQPRFSVLVKIDWPKKGETGLTVSGQALTKVFEQLFLLYSVPPSHPEELP